MITTTTAVTTTTTTTTTVVVTGSSVLDMGLVIVLTLIVLLALREILGADMRNRISRSFVSTSSTVIIPLLCTFMAIVAYTICFNLA